MVVNKVKFGAECVHDELSGKLISCMTYQSIQGAIATLKFNKVKLVCVSDGQRTWELMSRAKYCRKGSLRF
jgi:hypothetical protein